jgi:hypothetical protein
MSLNNGSKLMAVDTDDVLVHISTPWVERARRHPEIARYIPDHEPDALGATLIGRPQPYIQQWLIDSCGMPRELQDELVLIYRGDPNFYDDLPPTLFCKGIIGALARPGAVAHVHVLTHNYSNSDPCVESKDRWLRKHLGGPEKVTIHHIEAGQKKSDVLRQFCPEPDAFVDDSLKNVIDVLLNDAIRPHEIIIPRMGHNAVTPEIEQLAFLRRIKISYYEKVL